MTGKDRIILQKIIGYANDLKHYVDELNFETFMNDKKTISACAFTLKLNTDTNRWRTSV